MNHPYTNLNMETRRAKQRMIQVFQGRRAESLVEIEDVPVANQQKRATDRPWLSRELTRQCKVLSDLRKTERSAKESDWSGKDMSSFSFTLTLLLSGTIAAANADQPLFWLSIGPAPLAIGLAAAVFLRPRFDLPACLVALRKR
ncbi:MAG: hypothetical protein QOH31_4091 [Verrucomicrobiota bacterium]|jgi:hypothetical protein